MKPVEKTTRLWLCAVIVLALTATTLLATTLVFSQRPAKSYADALENVYRRNYYDLADSMSDLEVKLSKLTVAEDADLQRELGDGIWRQTGEITVYLSALPVDHHALTDTYKLINQVGDYIYALNKKLAAGGTLTEEEERNAETLYRLTRGINESLRAVLAENPDYRFTDHLDPSAGNAVGDSLVGAGTVEYPHLIYDGPFSDSLSEVDYSWLDALPTSTQTEALAWAQANLDGDAAYVGATDGQPACHVLTVGRRYVALTVQGLLPMTIAAQGGGAQDELQMDEAAERAAEWARTVYGTDFEAVWEIAADGVATINLAPRDGGVVYYTELVKLKVDLSDGRIVGAEGLAFLSNRGKHTLYSATRTVAEARAVLTKPAEVTYTRLALIPKGTQTVLCREFTCLRDGYTYIIYVDANALRQVDVMRVVDTDQGSMIV